MKFWELVSVCRWGEYHLMERLGGRQEWSAYLNWHRDFDQIVREQDREKLDFELPDEVCIHVLSGSKRRWYVSGGVLRDWEIGATERELTSVEAFKEYGGHALEDALEFGSFRVSKD